MELKIVTSVAPYVTAANAFHATQMAHEDGFSGIELNEDHLHHLVQVKPNCLRLIRDYSADKHMINSLHKTLFMPSIDSLDPDERKRAVKYTIETLDCMEAAGIPRLVLHSFSDLPDIFRLKGERAHRVGYYVGCHAIKFYGVLAPVLKAYRKARKEKLQESFMRSLEEIAKHAADKNAGGKPMEIVFEEHYSDAIDYDGIPYGKGNLANVIRGVDTAHQLIRTGHDMDLSEMPGPIHLHAVDTNGMIDDHRTIGNGRVNFESSLSAAIGKNLTGTAVLEDGTRKSALRSKEVLASMIRRIDSTVSSRNA